MVRAFFYSILVLQSQLALGAGAHVNIQTPRVSIEAHTHGLGRRPLAVPAVRRAVAFNAALYSPYLGYWASYPLASYYNGSLGYWRSSYGAYGAVYTQPGMFSSYHYGPFSYGSTTLTPTQGSHSGIVNASYTRVPGQSFSLQGTGPWGGSLSLNVKRW